MQHLIPDKICRNALAQILDKLRIEYLKLSRKGYIRGLVLADQDAKVLAVNSFFDNELNYWDLGAIGAALYGVSKQGQDFFRAESLDRASLIYKNSQFFVQSIGSINIEKNRKRDLILIVIGDRLINIGLIIMQMRKYAPVIQEQVKADSRMQETLLMSETEFMKHIKNLKKELFNLAP